MNVILILLATIWLAQANNCTITAPIGSIPVGECCNYNLDCETKCCFKGNVIFTCATVNPCD